MEDELYQDLLDAEEQVEDGILDREFEDLGGPLDLSTLFPS